VNVCECVYAYVYVCVCVCVCMYTHTHTYIYVDCFQIIFKFVVQSTTNKPREARFSFLDSVMVNTVVHTESEACQKQ